MNLLIEVNNRLKKYKESLEKRPEKRDVIQKEIDFLTKIKDDFIEIKDDLINFHDLVFFPDLHSEGKHEDLQKIQLDFVRKYPEFDSSLLRIKENTLDFNQTIEHLTTLYSNAKRKKEYFESQKNENKVKEAEKEMENLAFIFNQLSIMINLIYVCKFSLDYGFHIQLMKMFL